MQGGAGGCPKTLTKTGMDDKQFMATLIVAVAVACWVWIEGLRLFDQPHFLSFVTTLVRNDFKVDPPENLPEGSFDVHAPFAGL